MRFRTLQEVECQKISHLRARILNLKIYHIDLIIMRQNAMVPS